MNTKPNFNFLFESVSQDDLFEEKPHEKIAFQIKNILIESSQGLTIGLQGKYGVGKSTIISILEKLFPPESVSIHKMHFFYFDAWQHEGDPLRKVFLQELIKNEINYISLDKGINDTTTKLARLKKIRKKVSRKRTKSKQKTHKSMSPLGSFMAITATLTPLGIGLLTALDFDVVFYYTGVIDYLFIFCCLLTVAPLVSLLFWFFWLWLHPKKTLRNKKNWRFFINKSDFEFNKEVILHEDKTSVEFEKYFKKTLDSSLFDDRKLILVIDNLDRINPEDALKIWATLQTFIKQRNQSSLVSNVFNNINTIVPYDEKALQSLWNNQIIINQNKDGEPNEYNLGRIKHSFFDKYFQFRIDVPPPILKNWTKLLEEFVKISMKDWTESEKKTILNVFITTRESVTNNPTPRELKIYINQVGIYRSLISHEVPLNYICYFIIRRYVDNLSLDDIAQKLLEGTFIKPLDYKNLKLTKPEHFAALLFGLSTTSAHHFLLENSLKTALENKKPDKIINIYDKIGNSIYPILIHVISREEDSLLILSYLSVLKELTSTNEDFKEPFDFVISIIENNLSSIVGKLTFTENELNSIIEALHSIGNPINTVFINSVVTRILGIKKAKNPDEVKKKFSERKMFLIKFCQKINEKFDVQNLEPQLDFTDWVYLINTVNEIELERICQLIIPPFKIKERLKSHYSGRRNTVAFLNSLPNLI